MKHPQIDFGNKEEIVAFINKLRSAGINAYVVRVNGINQLIIK
jgi:cell division septation protein DedD